MEMAHNEEREGSSEEGGERVDPQAYATGYHAPVLWKEVIEGLIWNRAGAYVDATLGGGGHAAAILDTLEPAGRVIGLDQDADAVEAASRRLRGAIHAGRLMVLTGNFGALKEMLAGAGIEHVDGILLDLGVSSHQVDASERGFSYSAEGRLDMRMDAGARLAASEVINHESEESLRTVMWEYGEEPRARAIARRIVARRPLDTTRDLADIVRASVPSREATKSLSRVFQAFRIYVNRELEMLERVLEQSTDLLPNGGRIAVISYHSLEDRRVKRFFRYGNFSGEPRRDLYGNLITPWKEFTRRPIQPRADEIEKNPRARSARLRIAERMTTEGRQQ